MESPHKYICTEGFFPVSSVYIIYMKVLSHMFVVCCLGPYQLLLLSVYKPKQKSQLIRYSDDKLLVLFQNAWSYK